MQLNPSEISELLKQRIEGLGISADLRTQGTVVSVTDGICRVHGLHDVMQGQDDGPHSVSSRWSGTDRPRG